MRLVTLAESWGSHMLHSLFRHGQQLFNSSSLRNPPFSVFDLVYVKEPPDPSDAGLTNREAYTKISHEVQSYTALAVVSAVFASSNLGALRSIDEDLVTSGGFIVEFVVSVCLAVAALLSLYSTMISSLLRYYGYISIAQGTATTWVAICMTAPMIFVKKSCFWAFIGAFGLSLVEISVVVALKFSDYSVVRALLVLVSSIALVLFMFMTVYVLLVSRWLFGPQLTHESDLDADMHDLSVDALNQLTCPRPDSRWSEAIHESQRSNQTQRDWQTAAPIDPGTVDGDFGDGDGGGDDL